MKLARTNLVTEKPAKPTVLLDAPMGVTTDGTLVANVTHLLAAIGYDPHNLLDAALAAGRRLFVGVVLSSSEEVEAVTKTDDAAAEIVGMVVTL